MSTLSEHQANENAPEVSPQSTSTLAQLHEAWQHFDILSSKAEKHIFVYSYAYVIGCFLLGQLWRIPRETVGGGFTSLDYLTSLEVLFVVGICLVMWAFNVWCKSIPKTLQDIFEKHYISVHSGDLLAQYFAFLTQYRDALKNPRRFLLSALLVAAMVTYILMNYPPFVSNDLGPIIDLQELIVVSLDLVALLAVIIVEIGFLYCLGMILWSLLISGRYISRLARIFDLNIEPVHPDRSGGLHELGNFCFTSASPLLICAAFFLGWMLVALHFSSIAELGSSTVILILSVILLFVLPIAFYVLFRPLWKIHLNMLRKREGDEEHYVAEMATLREKIQVLLDANQLDDAKNLKDKKDIIEALHIPFPTWPFSFRSKILSTFLTGGGSLLLGVFTALVPPIIQTILKLPK